MKQPLQGILLPLNLNRVSIMFEYRNHTQRRSLRIDTLARIYHRFTTQIRFCRANQLPSDFINHFKATQLCPAEDQSVCVFFLEPDRNTNPIIRRNTDFALINPIFAIRREAIKVKYSIKRQRINRSVAFRPLRIDVGPFSLRIQPSHPTPFRHIAEMCCICLRLLIHIDFSCRPSRDRKYCIPLFYNSSTTK